VSQWPSTKARLVYRALLKIGWKYVRQVGSHKKLSNPKFPHNYTWAFGDGEDIGPSMLARIARKTGLKPTDL
jgi:predicted RNA binding protein YcfA (HicA-like mRNA interferase family)